MSVISLVSGRAVTGLKTYFAREIVNNSLAFTAVRHFSVTQSRNMKLIQFSYKSNPNEIRAGYVDGDKVVDINKADSTLPVTLLEILKRDGIEKVKQLKSKSPATIPFSDVTLQAPITGMDKVLCIGLNYKDHCEEQKLTPPAVPMIFGKFASCVVGPCDAVKLRTNVTRKVDWEVELCLVIGKTASNVKAANAKDYILGATVAQDISARDWQKEKNGGQFLLGKAMDTFCPIGPWIVTSDELGDPETLNIQCSVNGTLKQKSNTNQLVHKIPDVIERISSLMTLLPGDILLTGTPGGVGMYRSPPEYLKPGDVIASEIQKIGLLETRVEEF
ncbi:fumarylacetoacetate hydrolase domain-containing protein 2-like [Hyposmocoma kahamanoa]|uniref:fumarylacetoacetate hydrolase domain-containing protein 2-like n=1 Tax=Hyposmocoma kahamanoa TaxID=1477025 RepID=UPI000E6D6D03|nr:fumarylacetoacetate hydrolase domain-containing protein 2-like [Hyposmocoma kahamanoa]